MPHKVAPTAALWMKNALEVRWGAGHGLCVDAETSRDIQPPLSRLQLLPSSSVGRNLAQTCCLAKLTKVQGHVSGWKLEAHSVTGECVFKAESKQFPEVRWGNSVLDF